MARREFFRLAGRASLGSRRIAPADIRHRNQQAQDALAIKSGRLHDAHKSLGK